MRTHGIDVPGGRLPKHAVGMLSALDFAFEFRSWAETLRGGVTVDAIRAKYGVSRATAYRWKAAWECHVSRAAA